MKPFINTNILFIGIGFYDYEESIVNRLREHGAYVATFVDQPEIIRAGVFAGFFRRAEFFANWQAQRHQEKILESCKDKVFDKVLVIKGASLTAGFLQELRKQQPAAEFILYQWDSLARLPGIFEKLPLFDRVLSFDRIDTVQHSNIQFRPLFCRDASNSDCRGTTIDIAFVGWLHSDRLNAIRRMQHDAERLGLATYIYLYTGVFSWLKLALANNARDVHFRPLPYRKLMDINAQSRAILDLPHALQAGLTMRAIETICSGSKLLTTERDIENYDFYSVSNIKIVPPENIELDISFISCPKTQISIEILEKYTLDAWLMDVFNYSIATDIQ